MLHHLSIKRAIQVLRINNFEPNCLRRRPSDEVAPEAEVSAAPPFHVCDRLGGETKTHFFFLMPTQKGEFWLPQSLKSSLTYFSGFVPLYSFLWASLVAQSLKNLPAVQETQVQSLSWADPLEEEMATHSSTVAWRIPWTEGPGGLQSMGSQRAGHS